MQHQSLAICCAHNGHRPRPALATNRHARAFAAPTYASATQRDRLWLEAILWHVGQRATASGIARDRHSQQRQARQ